MKHQHHLLSAFLGLLSLTATAQVISVHRNGQSFFHYDVGQFETLIETTSPDHTLPGDTVVLPGGIITTGVLTLNKPLTFIGAGCLSTGTPVTNPTVLQGEAIPNNNLVIQPGAAGTSFHGIRFDRRVIFPGPGLDIPGFSTRFERCAFSQTLYLTNLGAPYFTPPSNVTLNGCVLEDGIFSNASTGPTNLACSNSFIKGQLAMNGDATNTVFAQCCLFAAAFTNYTYTLGGIAFINNIFLRSGSSPIGFPAVDGTSFQNNLFSITGGGDPAFSFGANVGLNTNNQTASINTIFEDVSTFTGYSELFDYHPATGSPALGAGVSGYDLGVYDGPPGTAWKELALPFNPHWIQLSALGLAANGLAVFPSFQASSQQDYGPSQLVGVRYWVGQPTTAADPGVRFKAIDPQQAEVDIEDLALDICNFTTGNQVLKLQLLDSDGRWSSVVTRSLNIVAAGAPNAVQAITPSAELCPGSTVTFTGTHTVVAPAGTPSSFTWSVPAGYTIVSGQGTLTVEITIGVNAGSINVTASNYCGDAIASFVVTPVQPYTLTSLDGEVLVCVGSSTQLTTQSFTGTYVWTGPTGWTFDPPNPTGNSAIVIPGEAAVPGPLYVVVLNTCGTPSNQVAVGLSPSQPADLGSIEGPSLVCPGASAVYTTLDAPGTYVWSAPPGWIFDPSDPDGPLANVIPGPGAEPGSITTYVIGDVCTSAVVSIAVEPFALSGIVGPTTGCPGEPVEYMTDGLSGTYVWSAPMGWSFVPPEPSGQTATAIPGPGAQEGVVSVSVVGDNCTTTVVSIEVEPDTTAFITMSGPGSVYTWHTATIIATAASGTVFNWTLPPGWSWSADDTDMTDGIASLLAPSTPGEDTICVTSTSTTGCVDSACWPVTVELNVAIANSTEDRGISVQPNPSSGRFMLNLVDAGPIALLVRDAAGRVIWSQPSAEGMTTIDLTDAPNGVYLLEARSNDRWLHHERIIVQH